MSIAQSWRPKHVLAFVGLTLLLYVVIVGALFAFATKFPSLMDFLHTSWGQGMVFIMGLFVILSVSLFIARVRSLADFVTAFDLTRPREQDLLSAFGVGLLIQFVGIFIFVGNLSSIHAARTFPPASVVVLLAPFFEEPAMRGFAYKALRNSYPVAVSICLMVLISLLFHWGQIYGSLKGTVTIAAINATLCLLKEKYSSLWICVTCHLAFNLAYVGIGN